VTPTPRASLPEPGKTEIEMLANAPQRRRDGAI